MTDSHSRSEEPTSISQPSAAGGGTTLGPGSTIGRYKILRLIGEGGMGAVYEAEQEQPRRTVALKVIRAGLGSADLLRRFEQEAQALGRLQHVCIAQIHEAGTADAGFGPQPYFAMEYIRGRSLREHITERQLGLRERLELVAKVCEAVHHAHQRGLIHRDLKPGNILVDETGQPKVLDFGVARFTDGDAQATLHTHVGEIIGTIAYMSPEQVLGDPLEIDARSDVYALGVILYEVLADRLPYQVSRKIHEAVETIRQQDPPLLGSIRRDCKGDIETITAKALEKDKARRYASAASLAEDIHRHLRDEPIVARPPSATYQLQKLVRRHKALVGGTVAVAAVLTIGIIASTWQARRASRAEQSVLQERDRASTAKLLTDSMPVDPQIILGELPNGLRYYVRANKKPEKRAELRLVVKAGSVLEEDDQQGLAHFVEHMAFNGTQHFPKNEIVAFIQSLGMRFGGDLNAGTSFDETTYTLKVPTDQPQALDRSLLILEDWAHNISFDDAEIDRERGVVLEEWRLNLVRSRVMDRMLPILVKGSSYANRKPIGKPEIIRSFKPERLKQFYRDWYRPDLMAVIVVGDFDAAATESLVKAHFAGIAAPALERPRPSYDVDHPGTLYAIVTDKETTSSSVEVDNLLPVRVPGSISVYQQQMVDRLFSGMLTARFGELAQQPDAPFMSASVDRSLFLAPSKEQTRLHAQVKEGGVERGLDALLTELERVARFGFTATELQRQQESVLRSFERLKMEDENRPSASRADEYVRNFLHRETLPGAAVEYDLHRRLLPQVTLEDVNKLAREWFPERNRLVIVQAPERITPVVPDEQKLAAQLKTVPSKDLKPYVDAVAALTLLDAPPSPGRVVSTAGPDAAGLTTWALSNGVKVVLKPTMFKEDEILVRATSPGGTSLASDEDYIPASTAAQVVAAGGLGKLSAVELKKALTGKAASVTPAISELDEGLAGNSSRRDLETLFQLIYLRFTQPRRDETAFAVLTDQMRSALAGRAVNPGFAFSETLSAATFQNHLRRRPLTAPLVGQMNLDRSLAFYKDRFADASDFTFVFVGSFDAGTLKPLVERYLGGLPSLHRQESWKDVGVRNATGVVEKTLRRASAPQSQTAIVFSGPFVYDQTHRVAINAMTSVLQTRLLKVIREALGGTYGITVTPSYAKLPAPTCSVTIQFGSDPLRTDELTKRVFQEIEKFKAGGPTDTEVRDEREARLRDFETNSLQNSYLLGQLIAKYQNGEDPATLWAVPDFYRKLDAALIRQAAGAYLNTRNYVRVTLLPEEK